MPHDRYPISSSSSSQPTTNPIADRTR